MSVSLLLTITADGGKLPPLFIFKSKKGGTIEKHLNKYKEVINHNAIILCNENAWCTFDVMKKWLFEIWLPYIKSISSNGNGLIILDMCTSHIKEDFNIFFYDNNQNYCLIPGGLTLVLQPLYLNINKPLKQRLTQIYCDNFLKSIKVDLVQKDNKNNMYNFKDEKNLFIFKNILIYIFL